MAHKISYRHPHYPDQVRNGIVLATGADGHTVMEERTGQTEYVRHGDVIDAHWSGGDDEERQQAPQRAAIVAKSALFGQFPAQPHPAATLTPDELRMIASKYDDQFEPGHPARIHPEDLDWHFDPTFPLSNLPGDPVNWIKWHARVPRERHLGYASQPHERMEPIVVVLPKETPDYPGAYRVWDGNHRIAEMHEAGATSIPAIVGIPRAENELPPGSEGRTGVRKSRGDLMVLEKATDAYAALRQRSSAAQVVQRLQSQGMRATGVFGTGGRFTGGKSAGKKLGGGGGFAPGETGQGASQRGWGGGPPTLPRSPHQIGEMVQYQRPDMDTPGFGTIKAVGRHGAHVETPEGGVHKVRHEHIIGNAMLGLPPDWSQQAADHLAGLGAKVHPFDRFLLPGATQRPTATTTARLKALVADGVPIDMKRIGEASEEEAHRLVEGFAGKLPRSVTTVLKERRKGKAQRFANPYREDD